MHQRRYEQFTKQCISTMGCRDQRVASVEQLHPNKSATKVTRAVAEEYTLDTSIRTASKAASKWRANGGQIESKWRANGGQMEGKWRANREQVEGK